MSTLGRLKHLENTFKILIMGDASVGKTSILTRYADSHFGKFWHIVKVQIIREGHKNFPNCFDGNFKINWESFSNFVAFSQYLNFTSQQALISHL